MPRPLALPLLVAALLASPAGRAAEPDPGAVSGDATVTLASGYVFRGFRYGEDSLVIQPAANLGYRGFTLGFWANVDTDQKDTKNFVAPAPGERQLNEADLSLAYGRALGPVTVSGGWYHYATAYAPETEEVFLAAAVDVPARPILTVYRDIRAFPGWYASLALSHELELPLSLSVEVSAAAGYLAVDDGPVDEEGVEGTAYRALHDGCARVKLTIPLPEGFSIRPWASYTFPLSAKAEDEALLAATFVGALDLTREF